MPVGDTVCKHFVDWTRSIDCNCESVAMSLPLPSCNSLLIDLYSRSSAQAVSCNSVVNVQLFSRLGVGGHFFVRIYISLL